MGFAVLICGEYREFDIAVQSFNFLNDLDCDVYFSTWNISEQNNPGLNFYLKEEITEERIRKHLPNATISILNVEDYNFTSNQPKMVTHWKNAVRMCNESGKNYDSVLIIRPDVHFFNDNPSETLLTYNEPDRLYGEQYISMIKHNIFHMLDMFFIGCLETVTKYVESVPLHSTVHIGIADCLISLGLYIDRIACNAVIIRPNCRQLINSELSNRPQILQKNNEWFDKFHEKKSIV
jgi:hypothetical protein